MQIIGCRREHAELYCAVHGLAGEPPKPLRAASDRVTGERVRAIVGVVTKKYFPELIEHAVAGSLLRERIQALLPFIQGVLPGTEDDVKAACALKGIHFKSPIAVVRWAQLLGIETGIRLDRWRNPAKYSSRSVMPACAGASKEMATFEALVADSSPDVFSGFMVVARTISRRLGAISAREAAAKYTQMRGFPVAEHEAVAMLEPFAVNLGRHDGDDWYGFFSSHNCFVQRTAGILAAVGSASFEDLYEGHLRSIRGVKVLPDELPREPLRRLLQVFGFDVTDEQVTLRRRLVPEVNRPVSPVKRQLLQIFKTLRAKGESKNGWVTRPTLMKSAREAGLNEITVQVYMAKDPLFESRGGHYRVVGTQPSPNGREAAVFEPVAGMRLSQLRKARKTRKASGSVHIEVDGVDLQQAS